jgi:ribosomal-protein-alanine N-acetyltransferase
VSDPGVRTVRSGDEPTLGSLQTELADPSPDLLEAGLSGVGTVLVSPGSDGRAVGYLLAVPGETGIHVSELVVAPGHRREGRATALLEAVCDRAGKREVTIAVAPENEAARACYEECGFRVRERVPAYFGDDPALVMVR